MSANWQKPSSNKMTLRHSQLMYRSSVWKNFLLTTLTHVIPWLYSPLIFLFGMYWKKKCMKVTFIEWRSWKHQLLNTLVKYYQISCRTCSVICDSMWKHVSKPLVFNSSISCRQHDNIITIKVSALLFYSHTAVCKY